MESSSKSAHFLEGKKIIVAGSGFAGLAFVVALRKQWDPSLKFPEIVMYDRDAREAGQKREGYSLSLNGMESDSGLIALRDLGLLDKVLEHAVAGNDSIKSFRMWDKDWNALMAMQFKPHGGLPTAGIRIARKHLRDVLVTACEGENVITWDTACVSAECLESGRIRVELERGGETETDECDLLVAADGAHSKVRAAIRPDDGLIYCGVVQIGGVAKFPEGLPSPIDSSWGMAVSGQGVGCFMAPVDSTSAVWAVSRHEPQERTKPGTAQSRAAVLEEARQIGHMLRGPFPAVVDATDPSTIFVLPARDKEPFSHGGAGPARGIVFVGDSNHAVSPFAGNGANLALKDGWDLAAQLWRSESLDEAVAAYDRLAVPRAAKTLRSSHWRMGVAHCAGVWFALLRCAFAVGSWFVWLAGKTFTDRA